MTENKKGFCIEKLGNQRVVKNDSRWLNLPWRRGDHGVSGDLGVSHTSLGDALFDDGKKDKIRH